MCPISSHTQRYPGQVTLKSSRLRLNQTHSRKKVGQQPSTQAASVQTDCTSDIPQLSAPPPPPDFYCCDSISLPMADLENLTSSPPFLSLPPLTASPSALLTALPPPPPPPPLPPPPPPSLENQSQGEFRGQEPTGSPVRQLTCESESPPLPLAPFSPRFFDSSQLLTARKKLRKTASLDSTQWRRGEGATAQNYVFTT